MQCRVDTKNCRTNLFSFNKIKDGCTLNTCNCPLAKQLIVRQYGPLLVVVIIVEIHLMQLMSSLKS